MPKDTTLYDRLGVSPNATEEEIKKAGTKMSFKWHPDKNINNIEEATKKFKEVREAVDILTDKSKRELYDRFGMDMDMNTEENHHGFPFPGGFPGMGGFPFPGGFPGMGGGMPQKKEENITYNLKVNLSQIFREDTVDISYDHKKYCTDCNGEGSKDGKKVECSECKGKGMNVKMVQIGPGMIQQSMSPCSKCEGKGKMVQDFNKCGVCQAKGYLISKKDNKVKLKKCLDSGMKMVLNGEGHNLKYSNTDLVVIFEVEDHPTFNRKGNDLFYTIELSLYEALFGFIKTIVHLDERELTITHKGKTECGSYRKILDEGLTNVEDHSQIGDLYIKFIFSLPFFKNEEDLVSYILDYKKDDDNININIKDITCLYDVNEEEINNGNGNGNNKKERENMENVQQCRPM